MQHVDRARTALLAMQRHSWEQGTAMQAFLESGQEEVVVSMAQEAVYRAMPDGRVATIGVTNAVTDPCACGEGILWAARETGDPALKAGHEALLRWALETAPRNAEGICYHITDKPEFWVDSMYMLPPYLAAAGEGEEAMRQWRGYYNALHDPASGLLSHIWDDGKKAFARAAHWGGGNGWAVASIARMIPNLPAHRDALAEKGRALIDSLMAHIRPDGLFHDVVDDPATFVETNLTQMLGYAVYRGLIDGWLPDAYAETADRLYQAALAKVDRFGLVRDVCGAPTFDKPGVSPEGQAFFLLISAVREQYTLGMVS